jgi:hypothetical protein
VPENAFFRAENLRAFDLQAVSEEKRIVNPRTRAPIRLLSLRAPRQAVLRTSSWLVSSVTTRPCDLPVGKTQRRVRPISATQTRDVHQHLVCSRLLTPLSRRGRPAESQAPHGRTRVPDVSRRPRTLRRIVFDTNLMGVPRGFRHERGRCLSHGIEPTEPLTPLSRSARFLTPLQPSPELPVLAVSAAFGLGARVGGCERCAEIFRERFA